MDEQRMPKTGDGSLSAEGAEPSPVRFMREALALAAEAGAEGEVPVGCVITLGDRIVALSRLFGVSTDFLLTGELLTPGDQEAVRRVVSAIRARADEEITLRRADGSETRLSTRELAMACAAVLG